jgi:hypothetical protein
MKFLNDSVMTTSPEGTILENEYESFMSVRSDLRSLQCVMVLLIR